MQFYIRADASQTSGAGHVMRCMVLAEELFDRGHEVHFVGEVNAIPWLQDYMDSVDFASKSLPQADLIPQRPGCFLIVDSYDIPNDDPYINSSFWHSRLFLIDDVTPKYKGDLYVHPGPRTNWVPAEKYSQDKLHAGTEYILIRKSLRTLKSNLMKKSPGEFNILLSAGGSDSVGFGIAAQNILSKLNFDFKVHVLSNASNEVVYDSRFRKIDMGASYEEIIGEIDLVITPAGTSSWEFIYLGIPTMVACTVPNQLPNYDFQIENGLSLDFGFRETNGFWRINSELLSIFTSIRNGGLEVSQSENFSFDGEGAKRILAKFLERAEISGKSE